MTAPADAARVGVLAADEKGVAYLPGTQPRFDLSLVGAGRSGVKVHKAFPGGAPLCNSRIRIIRAGYKMRDFSRLHTNDFCQHCFAEEYAQRIIAEAARIGGAS